MHLRLIFSSLEFLFLLAIYVTFNHTYFLPVLLFLLPLCLLFQGRPAEKFFLILGSFLQLTYLISLIGGDSLSWSISASVGIAFSVQMIFFLLLFFVQKLPLRFRHRWIHPWLIAFLFLLCSYFLNGLENLILPKVAWALSYMIWPFLLGLHDLKDNENQKINPTSLFLCLCPPWYARLFQNIPTEYGPKDFSRHFTRIPKTSDFKYQKMATRQMRFVLLVFLINSFLFWIAKGGGRFLNLPFLEWKLPWRLPDFIDLHFHEKPFEFLFAAFFQVVTMFFQFIILSSTANAIALFLGFQFTHNERVSYGLKMARSWSLLMHYLNHLVKTIFFYPAIRYLSIIKNRRHRNMFAAIFSIYSFGFCYLAFLPYGRVFKDGQLTPRAGYRALYLSLICVVAALRIYGPKVHTKTLWGKFLHYLIPVLLIFVMSMGILSLSL